MVNKLKGVAKKLLWVDLEMTGLSPTDDLILEVSAIVTDWDFNELDTYESIVKHNFAKLKKCIDNNPTDFWKVNPEYTKGFLDRNKEGKSSSQVERGLIKLIEKNFDKDERVILAGNSIHNDRRFIINYWPSLDKKLHYRMLDVTAWKIVFQGKYKKLFITPDVHRAIDDIRVSIQELKYYLGFLKK